ncbi:hypothetical protein CAPTEDRAFT_192275 [Capitella teleta]|uniref:Uncharacterized protein n=1 Tax=Capitella teleta TaxID=283909 RepID=R7UAD7_CAPTE|nr:hypothetical protein CAPTEDRAFT_192275 [Capitella teleta]|eukprot:ELU03086.1 hypothetical protein CAPTEDRAFT_192275 [Capitella teleta]
MTSYVKKPHQKHQGKVASKALRPREPQPKLQLELDGTQLMISNNNFAEPQVRPETPLRCSVPMSTPTDFDHCIVDKEKVLKCNANINYNYNEGMEKPTKNATIVDLKLDNTKQASPRSIVSRYTHYQTNNQTTLPASVSADVKHAPEAPIGCRAFIRKFQKLTPFAERIVPQATKNGRYGFESIEKTTHRNQQPPVLREPVYKTDSRVTFDTKLQRNTVLLKPIQTQNHIRNLIFGGPGCSVDLSALPPQRYNDSQSFFLTDLHERDQKLRTTPAENGLLQLEEGLPHL